MTPFVPAVGRQRGFTLLEVLIAMTLSVILLAIVTAGMRSVVDEWQERSSGPFEDRVDAGLILLQIERALLGSEPHSYIDQDTLEQNVFFVGTEESVTWISSVSPQARQQLTAWQLIGTERDGVVLKSVPAFAGNPLERLEETTGSLILPDFELVAAYLDIDDVDRPDWLDEWDGVEYQLLPMAVRLRLIPPVESDDDEIELVVPLLHRQHESIAPVDIQ
jgi:general secretion pathway protein J